MTPCTRGIQGIGLWGWKAGEWQPGSRGEAWGLLCGKGFRRKTVGIAQEWEEASRCRLGL